VYRTDFHKCFKRCWLLQRRGPTIIEKNGWSKTQWTEIGSYSRWTKDFFVVVLTGEGYIFNIGLRSVRHSNKTYYYWLFFRNKRSKHLCLL